MVLVLIKVPCSGNVLRGTRLSLKNDNKLSIIEIRKSTLNKCIIWSNPKIKFAFISSHYWEGERESKMDWINGLLADQSLLTKCQYIHWWRWQCSADAAAGDHRHQEWVEEYVDQHLKDPGITAMSYQIIQKFIQTIMIWKNAEEMVRTAVSRSSRLIGPKVPYNSITQSNCLAGQPNSDFVTSWKITRTGVYAYRSIPTLSFVLWFLTVVGLLNALALGSIRKGF